MPNKRNRPVGVIVLLAGLLLSGCVTVTQTDIKRATERVDQVWGAENAETLRSKGSRRVDVTKPQAIEAVSHALEQIGFDIVSVDRDTGTIRAERYLDNSDLSDKVRELEEPRLRRILVEEVGMLGMSASLTAEDHRLNAIATVKREQGGSRITIRRVWTDYFGDRTSATEQIAPAALRAGMYEFWGAVDKNVSSILADQPVVTDVRKSPSEWILPPKE